MKKAWKVSGIILVLLLGMIVSLIPAYATETWFSVVPNHTITSPGKVFTVNTRGTEEGGEVYTTTIEPIVDTYVDRLYHWKNFGDQNNLCVLFNWSYTGGQTCYISFLKFNLSDIPSPAKIVSAELYLRVVEYSVDTPEVTTIKAHRYLNSTWDEHNLTWDGVNWDQIQNATSETEIYVDLLETQVWFNWTITEDVKKSKDGFLTEVLSACGESIFFYSKETSLKPYLNVTYTFSTPVGGIIWEDTTWTLENSPYIITETVQIPETVTLKIEPGVTVIRPTSGEMFLLHGRIEAHGTNSNTIVFDGGGNSNFFSPKKSVATTFLNLSYCIIRNGLSLWPPTGYSACGSFSIKYSELINLASYSFVWYPERDVHIEYNTFINTTGFSIGNGVASVYIRYNLFKGGIPDPYRGFYSFIENWNSGGTSQTIVKYNSFIATSGIVLRLPSGYSGAAMTATENYWGTTDIEVIDTMIYDKNDDITCAGFIEYLPILTEPHPNTPTLPLIASFTHSPSVPYVYGAVTFDASASFGQFSTITNYTWDFGDGNTTTLNMPIATYTYTILGSYNVTLTVTDEFGFKNSTTTSVMLLQDDVPPTIEIPSRMPEGDVELDQEVRILVNVTDLESGVKNVTLSCLNMCIPVSNFTTVKDLYITLWLHRSTYYYKDPVSGDVTITYLNGTAFRGAFILYIRHLTKELMSTTAWIAIDGFTKFYLSPPVFQFGPGNYTIGMSSLSTADGYIIESRWQVFPSVQVEAKDDSIIWTDLPMTFNSTTGLYEATILGQGEDILVRYKITAYDKAGNYRVEDKDGEYYIYTVIPEFTSTIILLLFMMATLAVIVYRRKRVLA